MLNLKALPNNIEIQESLKNGNLLLLWLEIWPYCHLNCIDCFNNGGKGGVKTSDWFTTKDYFKLIDEFFLLGGKYIGIPGYGEPFLGRNTPLTLAIIEYAQLRGIQTYVFTTGDTINQELAESLYKLDVSLMIKFNSFRPEIQDTIVRSDGYTKRREKALDVLFNIGFNQPQRNKYGEETTHLGFVTSITPQNKKEIPVIWEYCLRHNIMPDIDTILPMGRGKVMVSPEVVEGISMALTGKPMTSPTYLGGRCDRVFYGLYVGYKGNVFPCLGCKNLNGSGINLGTFTGDNLKTIWDSELERMIRSRNFSGKCLSCQHFIDRECNSCFGRCCVSCSIDKIEMAGCSFFK